MTPAETLQPLTDETTARARREPIACTADTAECTCPDFCERDHEVD